MWGFGGGVVWWRGDLWSLLGCVGRYSFGCMGEFLGWVGFVVGGQRALCCA